MIRVATPEDAAAFAAIYAPIVTDRHISFEEQAPSDVAWFGRDIANGNEDGKPAEPIPFSQIGFSFGI
jgi:L-amino acid N-acyltransferase YncA